MEDLTTHRKSATRSGLIAGLLLVMLLAPPLFALAQTYGSGTYGGSAYGNNLEDVGASDGDTSDREDSGTRSFIVYCTATRTTFCRPPDTGGVVSGPLSVGYVASSSASTSTAASIPGQQGTTNFGQFARSLQFLDRGADVRQLQTLLNSHGAALAPDGPGSPGNETDFFGTLTYAAVVRFQEMHAESVLVPLGLTRGTGFFGPATRSYLTSLLSN